MSFKCSVLISWDWPEGQMQYNAQTDLLRVLQPFNTALLTFFDSQWMHFFIKSKLMQQKQRFVLYPLFLFLFETWFLTLPTIHIWVVMLVAANVALSPQAAMKSSLQRSGKCSFLLHTSRQDNVTGQTTGFNIKIWNIESNNISKSLEKLHDWIILTAFKLVES